MEEKKGALKIGGVSIPLFLIIFVLTIIACIMGVVEDKMMGAYALTLVLGLGLNWVGDHTPVLKDYGFGSILVILLPALCVYWGILPENTATLAKNFFTGYDFTSFLVPGLIIGSILAMDRKTLINAGLRFIIPMFGTLILTFLLVGLVGKLIGYGFGEAILMVAGPIMGAGVGASAVPLASIYADVAGTSPDAYLTTLTAGVTLANIIVILVAALMGAIGRKNPHFLVSGYSSPTEDGILRPHKGTINITEDQKEAIIADPDETRFSTLQTGFLLAAGFYMLSRIIGKLIPTFHAYVWLILGAIVVKALKLLPKSLEDAAGHWTSFFTKVMTPVILAAISLGLLDIAKVVVLMSDWRYLLLVFVTVIVVMIVSGVLSYLFGFYLVEGIITSGLGLADAGGGGDVAILSSCKKMYLMPFVTISTRVGGAVALLILTMLASMFLK